ncbi:hypothetical protein GCM10009616_36210 [Microlunatus lacustris]
MTAVLRGPRIVHVSHTVGDDQLGDGSSQCPVRTRRRAKQIAGPDDIFCVDGFIAAPGCWSPRRTVAAVAGITLGLWLLILLAAQNPGLAVLVGGSLVILWAAVVGETKMTAERQAELDRPQVHR